MPAAYGDLESYFYGARFYGKDFYGFDFDATYIKEGGDYSTDEIDAYAYHGLIGYTLRSVSMKPCFSVEYSYASGDSDKNDGKHKTFDTAFTGKTLFGKMSLMAWRNLEDYQVNFGIQPLKALNINASYHRFKLAEAKDAWYLKSTYKSAAGAYGRDLGQEIDITAKIDVIKGSALEIGYGHFFAGKFVENLSASTNTTLDANWIYVQWESKFNLGLL